MKIEEIIYDIKEILHALEVTTRVKDAFLIHKINGYRSLMIQQKEKAGEEINPVYFTRLPKQKVTNTGSGDHPDLNISSVKFGRISLPNRIALSDNIKSVRVMSSSRQELFYPTTLPVLMEMIEAEYLSLKHFHYYFIESNILYVYKTVEEVDLFVLLDDPVDGYSVKTDDVPLTSIEAGEEYAIASGSVKETISGNVNIYTLGNIFTGQAGATYSGDGVVKLASQVEALTYLDEYPMDRAMAQQIVILILTNEYRLEKEAVVDIYNDAQDQFNLTR